MDQLERLTQILTERFPGLELREYEPMSRHTTFRIGGPARLMALPRSAGEAKGAVRAAAELGVSPFFLGNGSNLLVADEGYGGFVLKTSGMDQCARGRLPPAGGERHPPGPAGGRRPGPGPCRLEFAHGIPGTLGGAVVMNAGAYGGEMVQVLTSVTYLDRAGGDPHPARGGM